VVERGRSFDRAAAEYARGRPGWPEGVLDVVPVAESATVLDLGAGTGKLTEVLARRYARVIAVEPLVAMREILERNVPAAEVTDGRAESIPLGDAEVDAVFAAQAFHWFANDEAVTEIARVLRPGGVLVLLWNSPSKTKPSPLPEAYRKRLWELRGGAPPPMPEWSETLARAGFGELETATVDHVQVSDKEAVLAFAASVSWIASRDEAERREVMAELDALLPPGEYRFPLRAELSWTRRTPERE
jgi:ubiquinone/menaquinone biosynthesis C-methylase UbiE